MFRIVLSGFMIFVSGVVFAQSYPLKPVRLVTSQPATGNDVVARIIAQGITAPLGQPVIVENRSGGVIAGEAVSKAPADGHTLLVYGNSLWLLALMRSSVPYDTLRDFSPVTLMVTAPSVLTVHPSMPVKSVRDLIALAKARPGQLNDGSPAVGTSTHMAAELFKSMAGVKIVRIAYKGGSGALIDLISGQIDLGFVVTTAGAPHIKSGRLRALGITSADPSPQFPGLPTIAASGLPGYESLALVGLFAPAKTPEAVIGRLNQEVRRVLARQDVKGKFLDIGVETVGTTPEQFTAKIKSEIVKWGKVIKEAGIRDDE
jgi:tripartite-type tricarboxylate transporter receptor subunit TctC